MRISDVSKMTVTKEKRGSKSNGTRAKRRSVQSANCLEWCKSFKAGLRDICGRKISPGARGRIIFTFLKANLTDARAFKDFAQWVMPWLNKHVDSREFLKLV